MSSEYYKIICYDICVCNTLARSIRCLFFILEVFWAMGWCKLFAKGQHQLEPKRHNLNFENVHHFGLERPLRMLV